MNLNRLCACVCVCTGIVYRYCVQVLFVTIIIVHFRGCISIKDREWFLRLANIQYMWKASTQLVNETVISSSYSEDLLGAMQKSLNRSKPRVVLNQNVNCVSMAIYKKHLSQLLGYAIHNDNDSLTNRNPLMMYKPEVCLLVY